MIFTPHDYQQAFLDVRDQSFKSAKPGEKSLWVSPTGTGKSIMELLRLDMNQNAVLLTPRLEIGAEMLIKRGIPEKEVRSWSTDRLADELLQRRISTPIRARNMLAKGEFPYRPNELIIDEGHHLIADGYQQLEAYLPEAVQTVMTATPYRGTPKGTNEFLSEFGFKYTQIIGFIEAANRGYISIPTTKILPLVDDDEISIEAGEFAKSELNSLYEDRFEAIADFCHQFYNTQGPLYDTEDPSSHIRVYDRPTIVAVNSTESAHKLHAAMIARGLPAATILQDTPRGDRNKLFTALVECRTILIQISVISEGVDLPIRRLIDARPLMSPMAWMQQIGRITRPTKPGEAPPEYICTCRNLERHAYLFEGMIPPNSVRESQQAFKVPSKRAGTRAVGLEGLARYTPIEVPLGDLTTGLMYQIYKFDGFKKTEYAIICHPRFPDPLYAARTSAVSNREELQAAAASDTPQEDNTRVKYDYGRWERIYEMPDIVGYSSVSTGQCTERQLKFWKSAARRAGLDPESTPTRKNFGVLPVFMDVGFPRAWR